MQWGKQTARILKTGCGQFSFGCVGRTVALGRSSGNGLDDVDAARHPDGEEAARVGGWSRAGIQDGEYLREGAGVGQTGGRSWSSVARSGGGKEALRHGVCSDGLWTCCGNACTDVGWRDRIRIRLEKADAGDGVDPGVQQRGGDSESSYSDRYVTTAAASRACRNCV